MEGLDSHSAAINYKARTAQIAAAGNKADDWKDYIDVVKLRSQSWDHVRRNRMIAYMYLNAHKMIPQEDKSYARAQLLVDYAEIKSHQEDKTEAAKMLAYARKILSNFAIVHVSSAEFELKRGNKEKAIQILKKAVLLKPEPFYLVTSALHQLIKGQTCTPVACDHEDMEHSASPTGSEKDCSGELSCQISGTFSELKQAIPGCSSNTQEVQHDLDMLASMPGPKSSSSEKQMQGQKYPQTPKNSSVCPTSNNVQTPEAPVLLLSKYSDRTKESFGHNIRQSFTFSSSLINVPETPQGQRLLTDSDGGSTAKKNLLHYHSTPDMRQHFGSAMIDSVKKYRPIISGPPRRVKINPDLEKVRDEEDKEEIHTQNITGSAFELLYSQSGPAGKGHSGKADATCPTANQPQNESCSGILQDISNTRHTDGANSLSASNSNTFNMLSVSNHSTARTSPASAIPSVVQIHQEYHGAFSNVSYDQMKEIDRKMSEEITQRKEPEFLKVRSSVQLEPSRKLYIPTSDARNHVSASVPQMTTANSGLSSVVDQYINVETTKEILAKQQEIIQQQQQLVQQLVQQQHLQAVVNNRTFCVPGQQQSVMASTITPAKPLMPSGQKVVFVNGKPYTVKSMIGRGGSAKVYKVYGPDADEALALKCVNLACANQVIVEGYKNEINLLKKLQQCNRVIKLYDSEYVEASKKLLVVLEYGETDLCKLFSENEKNREALHPITMHYFWFQMVLAVNAMHKEGVIHSDLKPANFILVSGKVKLIDFGIANSLQQDNTSVLKENMVGTPSYMSPETLVAINASHADSKPKYKVGVRSDVWSLGCILYQMVYGHTPFQHVRQKLEAIVNPAHEIPFPDKQDPALMDVLKKCLTRNIQQRPTTDDLLKHPYLQK